MVRLRTIAVSIVLRHIAFLTSEFRHIHTRDVTTYGEYVIEVKCNETRFQKDFLLS